MKGRGKARGTPVPGRFAPALVFAAWSGCSGATPPPRVPSGDPPAPAAPQAPPASITPPLAAAAGGGDGWQRLPDIAQRVIPSVVNVASKMRVPDGPSASDPFFRYFFGGGGAPDRQQRSLGSGVVVADGTVILTNFHVVEDAATVMVGTDAGADFRVRVVGTDPKSDLAVLRLEEGRIPPLALGDSDRVRIGEVVLAVGNPYGVGQTVTLGIVSALGRADVGISEYEDFIQTDAAINPGNSGGALVDLNGNLIGINTAILSRTGGFQGIGFAIPANMVSAGMSQILEHGVVVRGYLGVTLADLDRHRAEGLGLGATRGAFIGEVQPDSPAARAGLRPGDVVTRVDDREVASAAALRIRISSSAVGARVRLSVVREGVTTEVQAVLDALPDDVRGLRRRRETGPAAEAP